MCKRLFIIACLFLTGCATVPQPRQTQNLCSIFREYPAWQQATLATQHKWGISPPVLMAMMYQESSFNSTARPPRGKILGFIPGSRPTTAMGYCQAVNGTWTLYQHATGRFNASRCDFADAADFMGWYATRAHQRAGISYNDTYALYLAYHEGITNYMHQSYLRKPWLMKTAKRVRARASRYRAQWVMCE